MLAASYAGLVATLVLTRGELPARVASHFGAGGVPDDWMPRDAYLWSIFGFGTILPLVLIGSFYIMRFFTPSAMNLSHRDYWLAPERAAETYDAILRFGLWLASLMVQLLLGVHLLTVDANTSQPVVLSSYVWWLLGGFLAALGVLVFALFRRFKRSPE